jgi:WD40 repeat protein
MSETNTVTNDAFVAAARAVADSDGCVILTMTNRGFIDLTENLFASMAQHAPSAMAHVLLVALDDESEAHFASRVATVLLPTRRRDAVYSGNAVAFGTVEFISICHEKVILVAHLMRAGLHVLWTDTDIVWLDDARHRVARARTPDALAQCAPLTDLSLLLPEVNARARYVVSASDAVDFVFQADDDGLCAGFYWARGASTRGLLFMDAVLGFLNPVVCDQMSMRHFIDHSFDGAKLNVVVLDRTTFPNGTAYFNLKLPQRQSITPCIVHNNCIIGHDSKVRRFVEYRLWFRDVRPTPTPRDRIAPQPSAWQHAKTLRGHRDAVCALLALPERGELLSGSHDKTLRTWTNAEQCAHVEYMHKRGGVWALARVGETVFTCSHDRTAAAWVYDKADGKWRVLAEFAGHTHPVNALGVSGDALVTASDDGTLRSWGAADASKRKVFVGHTDCVTALAVVGEALFSASMDGSARAWQLSTGRCMQMYNGHSGWVRSVVAAGSMLYTGSADRTLRMWNQRSGDCLAVLPFDDAIATMIVSANERLLVGFDKGAVISLSLAQLDSCTLIRPSTASPVALLTSIAEFTANETIAVGFSNGLIEIWRNGHSEKV